MERDLVQAHERLKATLDALPDLLFVIDTQGRILDYRAPQPMTDSDPSMAGWIRGKVEHLYLDIHDRLKRYQLAPPGT